MPMQSMYGHTGQGMESVLYIHPHTIVVCEVLSNLKRICIVQSSRFVVYHLNALSVYATPAPVKCAAN